MFVDLTGKFASQHQLPITGMNNVAGDVVSLPTAGLLAQPSWIHWNKNSNLPDDVVIHFYEAAYPYNRVRSINRFEMQALVQLPAASSAILVKALCAKPNAAVKNTAVVKTKVAKKKATQLIEMKGSAHESLFSDQYIYHI
ncbi:MAG: hypothetical protein EOO03_15970 [Chitinophagaceae bacterium]|nr:MAG: hypothetical protein EOO03_15970 [Chitinophagaceae bacterium]